MVQILWKVDAFAHGLLAPIVSASLIWSRRDALARLVPASSWLGVLIVFAASLLWVAGSLLDFALFQHVALVTAIQGVVIGSFGLKVYRQLLFPMLFLYFSVPFGSELVTPLQYLTANLVIGVLDFIGADYTAQGMLITLPSGLYEVAEACAGVKFLFTSIFTGVLLSHLLYASWKKRFAVIAGSIVLPIVANALRVLLIFLIAELSDQKLAKGFDHLVYGWVFLSIVLFTLISVAYRYSDRPDPVDNNIETKTISHVTHPHRQQVAIWLALVLLPVLGLLAVPQSDQSGLLKTPSEIKPLIFAAETKFRTLANTDLIARPNFISADEQWSSLFRHNGVVFRAHLAKFNELSAGQRLFQPGNSLASEEWKPVKSDSVTILAQQCSITFTESILRRGESEMVVWAHHNLGGTVVTNSIDEKLVTAWVQLRRAPAIGAVIVLSAPIAGNLMPVRASFEEFLSTIALDNDLNGLGGVNIRNGGLCAG
ncbi:MAG: EpsI family protein [Kordiimonadaceae bacterium]|nr:EpsI family protein [Kordiimonadaceae bacterium]MBO6570420.1 EpsI family protein [Kordiimonadaceae bacterium]MBO6965482.1 EpsI family protein [Kordiimonadaceae bacterium]